MRRKRKNKRKRKKEEKRLLSLEGGGRKGNDGSKSETAPKAPEP
jgi:hypothetical protein